jgi:hypothetical protein
MASRSMYCVTSTQAGVPCKHMTKLLQGQTAPAHDMCGALGCFGQLLPA